MRAWLGNLATTTLAWVVVFLVVAAVLWGVYKEPAIVGSFATAAAAVVALVLQRDRENRREVAQRHREELTPFYDTLFKRTTGDGLDVEDPADQEFVFELQRKLIFFASTPVLDAWLRYLRAPDHLENDPDALVSLLAWEQVLFAIRADLGHSAGSLATGDLLRIYVHDADEALRKAFGAAE
jgi:hypothetical protein